MMNYLIFISHLSLLIWIYLAFFHGRKNLSRDYFFWSNKIIFEKQELPKQIRNNPKICAIIPARNEEKTILKTLNSLKEQKIKNLDIVVVDDNSSDKTSNVVNLFKKRFKKTYLISGKKLPPGWVGKAWAMKQGVDFANEKIYDFYTFVDSDIVIKRNLLKKVSLFMNRGEYLMISLMAKLNCQSNWEKLLIPPFIFFFQKLYPFNLVISSKSKISAAAGGFIFCKAEILRNENFYNKIKDKVIDDCNIANLFKKKGNIWLGLTNQVVSHRKYFCFNEIWRMVSRTAFEQLKHSIFLLIISIISLVITYIFPLISFFYSIFTINSGQIFIPSLIANILSFLIMVIIFSPTIRFYKLNIKYTLTLPLSASLYGLMTIASASNHFFFSGNRWKGRSY